MQISPRMCNLDKKSRAKANVFIWHLWNLTPAEKIVPFRTNTACVNTTKGQVLNLHKPDSARQLKGK